MFFGFLRTQWRRKRNASNQPMPFRQTQGPWVSLGVKTSTIFRSACVVVLLAFAGCVTSWDSGYRPTTNERRDIYTAVVRSRLARTPLAHHRDLYIFLNDEDVDPGVAARLSDYHVIVRSGSPGPSPRYARWYYLHMGRYTPDTAYVSLEAVERSGYIVKLKKRDGKWIVIDEQKFVLT